ncbi:hypothetical protein SFUMM280S_08626 [Streptomyces fumanus]
MAGQAAIPALCAVVTACARELWRHGRVRRRAHRALAGLPGTSVAVLPDAVPITYALPGGRRDRVVVTTALLACLEPAERRALFAHERAHLAARHHRFLLTVRLAALANPFLRPLRTAVSYTAERWADEAAAGAVGSRRTVATAIGKAALVSRGTPHHLADAPARARSRAGWRPCSARPRRCAAARPCSPRWAWRRGARPWAPRCW